MALEIENSTSKSGVDGPTAGSSGTDDFTRVAFEAPDPFVMTEGGVLRPVLPRYVPPTGTLRNTSMHY